MKLFRSSSQRSAVSAERRNLGSVGMAALCRDAATIKTSRQSAFTMVEIAIALAVIGFALVAIIGVLPTGLNVQQQNREETIINQDASIFLNAIRSGDRGLDFLTNYVLYVTVSTWQVSKQFTLTNLSGYPSTPPYKTVNYTNYTGSAPDSQRLTSGMRIVGLLSTPRYVTTNSVDYEMNQITAAFRSLSGAATDKYPQTNVTSLNLAFAYRLVPDISPLPNAEATELTPTFDANLHELRLRFSWPLLPNGLIGGGRQTFRTTVGGRIERVIGTNTPTDLYFLQKSSFITVQ